MNKILAVILTLSNAVYLFAGCKKDDGKVSTKTVTPFISNASDFRIMGINNYVAGERATLYVRSTTLGTGVFFLKYEINTGPNIDTVMETVLTMQDSVGSFQTNILAKSGRNGVVIKAIRDSSNSFARSLSMLTLFSDSIGLFTSKGLDINATYVLIDSVYNDTLGGTAYIEAIQWYNYGRSTWLVLKGYDKASVFNYNINDTNSQVYIHHYFPVVHGSVTITSRFPLTTGTFTFTKPDSSIATGYFMCQPPK